MTFLSAAFSCRSGIAVLLQPVLPLNKSGFNPTGIVSKVANPPPEELGKTLPVSQFCAAWADNCVGCGRSVSV
eukprot:3853737-Pyramimonas_sp.AAC.1